MRDRRSVSREVIRPSVIAGTWYPGDPDELRRLIGGYLERAARADVADPPVALVVPHAGYAYSGQVAACAYRQLQGLAEETAFERVVVVSPSHYPHGGQLLVTSKKYYETPLGLVEIDGPFLEQVLARSAPLRLLRLAHDQEHSLEIQLPFLQHVLPSFRLVPLVMEDQTLPACRTLAAALAAVLAEQRALLVASTDLSHFFDYATAQALDRVVLEDVERLDPEALARDVASGRGEACGAGPVVAVLLAARQLGATQARVLCAANSGDVTGDRWRVVGYGAAAVWR